MLNFDKNLFKRTVNRTESDSDREFCRQETFEFPSRMDFSNESDPKFEVRRQSEDGRSERVNYKPESLNYYKNLTHFNLAQFHAH